MGDCIDFKGCKDCKGYGKKKRNGKVYYAHRLSYCDEKNIAITEIDGLVVMHTCDNPSCVNPAHLMLGTHQDNMNDKVSKNRQTKGVENAGAKLTEKEVLEIRELSKSMTQNEISKLFVVSQSQISLIKNRKSWAWSHK